MVDGQLCSARNARTQFKSAYVENIERDLRTIADIADQVAGRDLAIAQNERCGRGRLDAHLVFLTTRTAAIAALDQERRKLLLLAIYLCKNDENIGKAAVR